MTISIGQIFALIAESPEAFMPAQEFAAWYNRHKMAAEELAGIYDRHQAVIGRIINILDPIADNPLPAEEARQRAIEIIKAQPELWDIRERSDGN